MSVLEFECSKVLLERVARSPEYRQQWHRRAAIGERCGRILGEGTARDIPVVPRRGGDRVLPREGEERRPFRHVAGGVEGEGVDLLTAVTQAQGRAVEAQGGASTGRVLSRGEAVAGEDVLISAVQPVAQREVALRGQVESVSFDLHVAHVLRIASQPDVAAVEVAAERTRCRCAQSGRCEEDGVGVVDSVQVPYPSRLLEGEDEGRHCGRRNGLNDGYG